MFAMKSVFNVLVFFFVFKTISASPLRFRLDWIEKLPAAEQNFTLIDRLISRIEHSDARPLVKEFCKFSVTLSGDKALLSTQKPFSESIESLVGRFEENTVLVALYANDTESISILELLNDKKQIENLAVEIDHLFASFSRWRSSLIYWSMIRPLRLMLQSHFAYQQWRLNDRKLKYYMSLGRSDLLGETYDSVFRTKTILLSTVYVLRKLKKYDIKTLIAGKLSHILNSDLINREYVPLSDSDKMSLGIQLAMPMHPTAFKHELKLHLFESKHKTTEVIFSTVLVILLLGATCTMFPLVCTIPGVAFLLANCFVFILGFTGFHLIIIYIYILKILSDYP